MPRTANEAVNRILLIVLRRFYNKKIIVLQATEGWYSVSTTCENSGQYAGFRYRLRNDNSINLLFDRNGIIAGIQALVSITKFKLNVEWKMNWEALINSCHMMKL